MEFNRGMVGVLLVILSLIASVGIGVVTNVESQTVTKEVEDYVADITGGFESEKDKSYTDYNPSSNYNGYTNNTTQLTWPVIYESSDYTNNYPISYEVKQRSAAYTSPTDFTSEEYAGYVAYTGVVSGSDRINNVYESPGVSSQYNYYSETLKGARTGSSGGVQYPGKSYTINMDDLLQSCITDGTALIGTAPEYIQVTIPSKVAKYNLPYINPPFPYSANPDLKQYEEVWMITTSTFIRPYNAQFYSASNNTVYQTQSLRNLGDGSDFIAKVTYNVSTNNMAYYVNDNIVFEGDPSNYVMIYGSPSWQKQGSWSSESPYAPAPGWNPKTEFEYMPQEDNLLIDYIVSRHVDYIDTRYGVGIRDSQEVVWSNNQENGRISLAFSTWTADDPTINFDDSGETYSNTGVISYFETDTTDTFTVSRTGGRTYVAINGNSPVDIGTWKQIQVDVDCINGKLIVYPINTWDNFNNYSIFGTSIEIGDITKANIKSITWTADNTFRLEVENTYVFFNTYGVVMIDPYITITDLWPNYDKFSVHISGVATIGNSITIGNTTYTISQYNFIVNDVLFDVTDFELEYNKIEENDVTSWEITISSGKYNTTVNESDTYLGFGGSWYFTAGFYNIVSKNVVERSWNSIYDWTKGHIFFWMAAILLVLGVVAYKFGYMDGLSAIILITTEVILFIIGGTT